MKIFFRLGRLLGGFIAAVFGEFSWRPPAWLRGVPDRLRGPAGKWVAGVFVCLLAFSAFEIWRSHQPPPVLTTVSVQVPGLPGLSDKPTAPEPLVLEFSSPAAQVDRIDRSQEGVAMQPEVAGTWTWQGDRRLVFQPKSHWPAATTYEVTLPVNALKRGTLLAAGPIRFRTLPFTATIENLEVSVNPKDESRRELRATLQFSHAVDAEHVREAVGFTTTGASPVFQGRTSPAQIGVRLARQGRLAFIDGGLVDLPENDDFIKLGLAKTLRPAAGGSPLESPPDKTLKLPSSKNFFKIESISLQENVVNPDGVPEQILIVRTSSDAKSGALDGSVSAWLVAPPE